MGENGVDKNGVGEVGGGAKGGKETKEVAVANRRTEGEVVVGFFVFFETFILARGERKGEKRGKGGEEEEEKRNRKEKKNLMSGFSPGIPTSIGSSSSPSASSPKTWSKWLADHLSSS